MSTNTFDWEWAETAPFDEMISTLQKYIKEEVDDLLDGDTPALLWKLYQARQEEVDAWSDGHYESLGGPFRLPEDYT